MQNAQVASANLIEDKARRVHLLLESLETTKRDKQADLLRPLSRIGGRRSLEAVIAKTKSEDSKIENAAISVLSEWPEFDAAMVIFEIFRESPDQRSSGRVLTDQEIKEGNAAYWGMEIQILYNMAEI